jgi:hypothetical protein
MAVAHLYQSFVSKQRYNVRYNGRYACNNQYGQDGKHKWSNIDFSKITLNANITIYPGIGSLLMDLTFSNDWSIPLQ